MVWYQFVMVSANDDTVMLLLLVHGYYSPLCPIIVIYVNITFNFLQYFTILLT